MERFDIIDERNRVLKQVNRNIAHKNHLLHRSVHIILVNNEKKVLLQLRAKTKWQYPNYWTSSVAGHVRAGETPVRAAYREMKEELGIKTKLRFIGRFIVNDRVEHEMTFVFLGRYNGKLRLLKDEMQKAEFFNFSKTKRLKLTPHSKKAIAITKKIIGMENY